MRRVRIELLTTALSAWVRPEGGGREGGKEEVEEEEVKEEEEEGEGGEKRNRWMTGE